MFDSTIHSGLTSSERNDSGTEREDLPHKLKNAGPNREPWPLSAVGQFTEISVCYDHPWPLKSLSSAQSIGVVSASIFYVVAGTVAFHQTRRLLETHASLYPLARGDGAHQRRVRDTWWSGATGPSDAPHGGVGTLIAVFPANVYMATNPIEAGPGLLSVERTLSHAAVTRAGHTCRAYTQS